MTLGVQQDVKTPTLTFVLFIKSSLVDPFCELKSHTLEFLDKGVDILFYYNLGFTSFSTIEVSQPSLSLTCCPKLDSNTRP